MAPIKKGGEKKKGRSAINEVVTREYTINIHKRIHGVWVRHPAGAGMLRRQRASQAACLTACAASDSLAYTGERCV